jgi:hypothetical protein
MQISLNNRHKAGLFLTTVLAGLCLILGETFRETTGAIIIGFALTWAFGSTNRLLRYCIGGLALILFIAPLIAALIDHHNAVQSYEKSLEDFRSKLPEFAKEHPDLSAGLIPSPSSAHDPYAGIATPVPTGPPPGVVLGSPVPAHNPLACIGTPVPPPPPGYDTVMRVIAIPNAGNIAFPCSMSDKDIAKALRAYPEKSRAPSWYLEALDAGVSPDDIDQLTPPLEKPEAFGLKHSLSDGALIEVPSAILAILFFGSVIAEGKRFSSRSDEPLES